MVRRLFKVIATISLLLFLVMALFCARSYAITDRLQWSRHVANGTAAGVDRHYLRFLISSRGKIRFVREDGGYPQVPPSIRQGWIVTESQPDDIVDPPGAYKLGASYLRRSPPFVIVSVRYWFPLVVLAIPPILWLILLLARRERRRREAGLCGACGYDLRGTPLGGRCPECGTTKA